jgi:hypothetical protein
MTDRLHFVGSGSGRGGSLERNYESVVGKLTSGSPTLITSTDTTNLYVGMLVTGSTNHGFVNGTHIESIDSSVQLTLSTAAIPLASPIEVSIRYQYVNYDIPTNPRISLVDSLSSTDRLYTGVFSDDSNSTITFKEVGYTSGRGINYENDNLESSEGYRIKCYDYTTDTGIQLKDSASTPNYTDALFDSNHFFVLLHSDDHLLHHFAKVTEILRQDVTGDAFEFEPRLGSEIPKGTKFMLFQGPAKTTYPLAVSAGIKMNLQHDLICARPLFYFFNDSLDKDNELNHNRKYYAYNQITNSSGVITLTSSALNTTVLTVVDYSTDIIDYSKYSLKVKLTDKLRILDAPKTNTSNEGNTPNTLDFTDYDDAFPNARRDDDDLHTTLQYRGPLRYLHYTYSPDKSNLVANAIDNIVYESYGQRGGYAETKIADMFRIMNKKIESHAPYRIRHAVHRADFNDWFDLDVKVLSASSPTYTFTTTYNLTNFLNAGDEVRVGSSTIFIIDSIGSFTAATGTTPASQPITFEISGGNKYHKTDGEAGAFGASTNPTISVDDILYRRAFNSTDLTLLTDFDLVADRYENLYINFIIDDYSFLRASVTAIDVEKKLLTLSFTSKTYGTAASSGLEWATGQYSIEIQRFDGLIEQINSYQEDGQRLMKISGRNNFSKLISPIINKNTIHSQDIIYSSNSPFNRFAWVSGSGRVISSSFDSKTVTVTGGHTWAIGAESAGIGLHIFALHIEHDTFSYIGKIASVGSSTEVTLEDYALAETSTVPDEDDDYGLYAETHHYIFNKALATNSFQGTSTDLVSASGKGLFFESGQTLSSVGAESTSLIGTSASDDSRALGYYLSGITSISKVGSDSKFQGRLDNNANPKTFQTFDTINTLIDFSILSIKSSKNATNVEIAPYMPLTLGRVDINYANVQDTTFHATSLGDCNGGGGANSRYFYIPTSSSTEALPTSALPRKHHNKPVYADGVFIGKIVQVTLHTDHSRIIIYVDSPMPINPDGATIRILNDSGGYEKSTKLTHELNLLNGGHLHTGKIISLLSPFLADSTVNKTIPLNYPLYYNTMNEEFTYAEKYGSPYYRIINLEKGNYNKITKPVTTDIKNVPEYYLKTPSKVPYYASAYRFGLGYGFEDIVGVGKTGYSTDNHLLPESRGSTSVYGSRFFDTRLHASGASAQTVLLTHDPTSTSNFESAIISKDYLNLLDHKVARMFLFANSDLYPYSSQRYDSLMYGTQTRDISNYNFFALEEPILTSSSDTKEGVVGDTRTLTLNDSNYSSANIVSADRTISDLKRFSMMRLTEVVVDWAFNQIDPENIVDGNRIIPTFIYSGFHFAALSSLFASTGQAITGDYNNYTVGSASYGTGSTTITHASNTKIRAGMPVSGSSIPADSTIASITDATNFVLSATPTDSESGETLTFGSYIATDTATNPASGNTAATATITVFDGDADNGMTNGQYVTLTSTDGTVKNYVVVDDNESSIATATTLGGSSDIGAGTLSDITGLSVGVAVTLDTTGGSIDTQNNFLVNLKTAIESAQGHPSKITVSSVPTEGNGEQYITLTQATAGESGNTVVTENISNVQESGFLGGTDNLVVDGDIIADANGRYIGEVADTEGSSSSWKIILMDKARKTNATNYYAGYLFAVKRVKDTSGDRNAIRTTTLTGHGKEDTFVMLDKGIHMLKSIIVNDVGTDHYGQSDSVFYTKNSERLGGTLNVAESMRPANTFLPIVIDSDSSLGQTEHYGQSGGSKVSDFGNHPFKLFDYLDSIRGMGNPATPINKESLYVPFLPIFLDRFNVEDGGGSTVSKGTVGGPVKATSMRRDKGNGYSLIGLGLLNDFAQSNSGILQNSNQRVYADDADGVLMGFKPRFYFNASATATNKAAGNRNIYNYVIDTTTNISSVTYYDDNDADDSVAFSNVNRLSLDLMNDLTGCYLVSEKGKYYDHDYVVNTYSGVLANTPSIHGQTPDIIAYVISHEIDTTNSSERHIITTDTALPTDFYRVMQPNHVCFYDYTPKRIRLNTLASSYTKVSGTNATYVPAEINSYQVRNKSGWRSFERYHNTGGSEAALSMYVVLDVDAQSDSNYVMLKDVNDIESLLTTNTDYTMVVADGEKVYKTSMTYADNGDAIGHYLNFDKMEEVLGVASISETINLTVNGTISEKAKRGMIGTVATICHEGEGLINDLLEENDIAFTNEDDDFPYFLAPNYKGVDLFSAINLILSKKNKTILVENQVFKVRAKTNTKHYPKIILSDTGDYQIFAYEEVKQLYDFYNEIIVYGYKYKATRKDLRSVKKIGRKTLEVYESNLTTQDEVDSRASELLRMHTDDNIKLKITVGHTKISQLRAGDVIGVELRAENIPLNEYIVLQIEHTLTGMMELELGRYSKQLEDRFAELLAENKKINADIRAKEFDESVVSYDFLDSFKIKEIRLLVRKVSSTGGATLGFTTTLNTSTTPMGFSGGSADTITDLVEEEF